MSDMIQSGFDYAALPVDSAMNARAVAERIKLRLKRTVEDIIEVGRELKEVKPSLEGVFGKWFENETGLAREMADKFIGVYEKFGGGMLNNLAQPLSPTVLYLLSAPSTPDAVIDRALEKAESGEKVTVANVKDWKAELDAEKRRSEEFRVESNERRKKIRELEAQIGLLESRKEPEPVKIEVAPPDYETAKTRAAQLERELAEVKKEQHKLINSQVKAKLHEYQSEVDEMEQRKTLLQEQVDRMKSYMASLESDAKRAEVHQSVINGVRLELINLAAFLSDEEPIQDADTLKRWRGLSAMLSEATTAIHQYAGDAKPSLAIIAGGAA